MEVFEQIPDLLAAGESFVMAVIVKKSGSAPRAAGVRMLVRKESSIIGTIGGGLIEAQVHDRAMKVFDERKPVFQKFSLMADAAARNGMICGGEVEVLIHFVDASQASELYYNICEAIRSRERAWLITEIPSDHGRGRETPAQCLVRGDGTYVGQPDGGTAKAIIERIGAVPELVLHEGNLFFVEPLGKESTVFIFGAGHVSQKLAPLTRLVGFRTVVLDDRSEFANRQRFQSADEIIVADSFDRAMDGLEIDAQSLLVLLSRGHLHDKALLKQALSTNAGYIGMIGSNRKKDAIYAALLEEGFARSEFDRVFSPIGLEIGAETPEEIAVSIVAQLIQVRAGRPAGKPRGFAEKEHCVK
jgi:xanthine dehydrogenase accessory factor